MAARAGLECDKCHRPKVEAKKYRVTVAEVSQTGDVVVFLDKESDLCKKDFDRMIGFIERGVDVAETKELVGTK